MNVACYFVKMRFLTSDLGDPMASVLVVLGDIVSYISCESNPLKLLLFNMCNSVMLRVLFLFSGGTYFATGLLTVERNVSSSSRIRWSKFNLVFEFFFSFVFLSDRVSAHVDDSISYD